MSNQIEQIRERIEANSEFFAEDGQFLGYLTGDPASPMGEVYYPKEDVAEAPDWDAYRREAAKAAMQGILSGGADWQGTLTECREDGRCEYPSEIANFAVACADELIKQLKEK